MEKEILVGGERDKMAGGDQAHGIKGKLMGKTGRGEHKTQTKAEAERTENATTRRLIPTQQGPTFRPGKPGEQQNLLKRKGSDARLPSGPNTPRILAKQQNREPSNGKLLFLRTRETIKYEDGGNVA